MLINWIKDVYTNHGYLAALLTIVVLVVLTAGVSYLAGIDLKDLAQWLIAIGG